MPGYAFNRLHAKLMIRPPETSKTSAVIRILDMRSLNLPKHLCFPHHL